MSHSYRDLRVWQQAMDVAAEVYRMTENFPRRETFGLTQQVRRAVISVASNIAEGQGRTSPREFRYFLGLARGSLLEAETQLLLSCKLGYVAQPAVTAMLKHSGAVHGMLNRLMDSLRIQASTS